ncbi:MAG: hypothetical protein ACREIA_19590, partial [Opitutaceae bacterium]
MRVPDTSRKQARARGFRRAPALFLALLVGGGVLPFFWSATGPELPVRAASQVSEVLSMGVPPVGLRWHEASCPRQKEAGQAQDWRPGPSHALTAGGA